MAKKKKVNKEVLFLLTSAAVCIAFMGFVVMFFPAVKLTTEILFKTYEVEISGIQAIFGGKLTEGNEVVQLTLAEFNFNIVSLIGYVLLLVSAFISVISFNRNDYLLDIVSTVLCVVAAIVIFLEPTIFASVNQLSENIKCTLLIGPILGGIFALLAAAFNASCINLKRN